MAQGNTSAYELSKSYVTTQINDSSTIAMTAGAAIEDVRCRAVKFDANGKVVLAAAGDLPLGVGIITNNVNIAAGDQVDVQWKNIGLVYSGDDYAAGTPLSVDANGCFVAATTGESATAVVAVALEAASGAGVYTRAILNMGNGYVSA
jgi:hypothetical protein